MTTLTNTALLHAFLDTTEKDIVPLIFKKSDLSQVMVASNHETSSPLLHGEINCIQKFYGLDAATRPSAKDCVFFATHEPCSLCLSGITWGGFDNHYFLFTYEDTRDTFSIPYDIEIIEEVFRVPVEGETPTQLANRALYNKSNKFWKAKSVADLVDELPEGEEKEGLRKKVEHVRGLYGKLSETYQSSKGDAGIPLA
ncbi:hypothetical protein MNV49_007772 [Pseudohyphozyma bogoriensis]|nr:hypothetical protein MNV49_007772 [Pseudohyphozyma bogoriensis]